MSEVRMLPKSLRTNLSDSPTDCRFWVKNILSRDILSTSSLRIGCTFWAYSKDDLEKEFGIKETGAIVNFMSPAEYNNPFNAHQALAWLIKRCVSGPDTSSVFILIPRIETQRESLEALLALDTTTEKEFSFGRVLIEKSTMVKTVSAVAVIPQQFDHKTMEKASRHRHTGAQPLPRWREILQSVESIL